MLSRCSPGLEYTGNASNPSTTVHSAATVTGVHHRPRTSLRPAKPTAAHNGANTKSCTTTPTAAHTAIRTMTSRELSHSSTAP